MLVNKSSDDAEELATGWMYLNSSDLELTWDAGGFQRVGMRFESVELPANAVATKAWIEFEADERDYDPTNLTIHGEASPFAETYRRMYFDISSRPHTMASVGWDPEPWTRISRKHRTPDLASVVNEIAGQPSWHSGNPMAFMISGFGERTAESFDGERANAPKLVVRWEIDGLNPVPTPEPTATPQPTSTPEPTATPHPTPEPTATPHPTPEPTATPHPTPEPTATPHPTPEPMTYSVHIRTAADDAEQTSSGWMNLYSRDLDLQRANRPFGLRYEVCVPWGVEVTEARLELTADERDTARTSATIWAERSADAASFRHTNLTNRTRTSASVTWSDMNRWSRGDTDVSPDLSEVINEALSVRDRLGCVHLVLILEGTGDREAISFETDPNRAPKLTLTHG